MNEVASSAHRNVAPAVESEYLNIADFTVMLPVGPEVIVGVDGVPGAHVVGAVHLS